MSDTAAEVLPPEPAGTRNAANVADDELTAPRGVVK